jgi:hypothetical protein
MMKERHSSTPAPVVGRMPEAAQAALERRQKALDTAAP